MHIAMEGASSSELYSFCGVAGQLVDGEYTVEYAGDNPCNGEC